MLDISTIIPSFGRQKPLRVELVRLLPVLRVVTEEADSKVAE